ncbi:MAG: BREX system Lon protease-like protein BrxL [Christensenellaceae bacterium]|jgi:ATP-dependent Lon protease|nr:BREX system Lon protease-like protein BrxL [Christensenellaceae bacterium]
MVEKLRNCFDEMVVYKNQKANLFSELTLPSFMRDWLLKKFQDEDGHFDSDEMKRFVYAYLPKREDWKGIKNRVIYDYQRVKFLAKVAVDIDIKTGLVTFSMPDYGLTHSDTIIDAAVWEECRADLLGGHETWGMVEIGYKPPDEELGGFGLFSAKSKKMNNGKIKLITFKKFCPYTVEVSHFKEVRREFEIDEWIDILLGAVDYNAKGFCNKEEKLTMLTRLLPFVEKRLNLIELAPKGTGKSYLFGRVSRFGWLSSGGVMSRAKMFYDQSKRVVGLVAGNDFITLDEVQTISFTNTDEIRAALKGYLEFGVFTVGNFQGEADAGVILCGNIRQELMNRDDYINMFIDLPPVFHESALIDRFHGFIKGWNIPRMTEGHMMVGWALNSEYFCSIMHELRSDTSYRSIVEQLIKCPEDADKRDTEAIKRIATAYLKLLFPHVKSLKDISRSDFEEYCFKRARNMRGTIKYQLGELDAEFSGKDLPALEVIQPL